MCAVTLGAMSAVSTECVWETCSTSLFVAVMIISSVPSAEREGLKVSTVFPCRHLISVIDTTADAFLSIPVGRCGIFIKVCNK